MWQARRIHIPAQHVGESSIELVPVGLQVVLQIVHVGLENVKLSHQPLSVSLHNQRGANSQHEPDESSSVNNLLSLQHTLLLQPS